MSKNESTGLPPRTLGVGDIDERELESVCQTIRHVVWKELQTSVTHIYVTGSFARGEARRVASDLDLRAVIGAPKPESEIDEIKRLLKNEYGPDVTPSNCGYLDVHVSVLHPSDVRGDTPNELVWSKGPNE
jgi:predicted nucleotidyltransferase